MKTLGRITLVLYGNPWQLTIEEHNYYMDGSKAIRLLDEDGMSYATLTCAMEGASLVLGENEYLVKTWSENEHLTRALITHPRSPFVDTGKRVRNKYVEASVWKLK